MTLAPHIGQLIRLGAMACLVAGAAAAQQIPSADPGSTAVKVVDEAGAEDDQVCFAPAIPVVSLGYPSRYTADSKTRSDFDESGNAAVEAALGPIDDFITDLARESNRAQTREGESATKSADCVLDRIAAWAKVDALSDIKTEAAGISVPSRVGGIAFAYANALPFATDDAERKALIEGWLASRADQTMTFFDNEAPPRASRNNLRAWAALAVARIGLSLNDDLMVEWADASVRLVACSANEDGSLPLEMERGPLALHYHIHAVGPLAVTAALLESTGADLFAACERAIPRSVGFMLRALEDPGLVTALSGEVQSFEKGKEKLDAFEIAWAKAYLAHVDDPALADLAAEFEQLSNSKFGGDQSLLW